MVAEVHRMIVVNGITRVSTVGWSRGTPAVSGLSASRASDGSLAAQFQADFRATI
jgi:hypothetical protein